MVTNRNHSRLPDLLKPLYSYFIAAGVFSGFINLLMIVPAVYMFQVYDRALASQSLETLSILTLIMVFLLTSMGALDSVRGYILSRASVRLDEILNKRVFEATFKLPISNGGKGSTQPISDLNGIRNFISSPAINAIFDTPWVPFYIVVMFFFHTSFGLMAIASVLIICCLTWVNQYLTKTDTEKSNNAQIVSNNFAAAHLRNAEVIYGMGMMEDIRKRWNTYHLEYIVNQKGSVETSTIFTATSRATRMILQSLTLGLGAYLAINMEISPGMMIAGSILLGRAMAPVDQLIGGWKGIQQARLQYSRIDELLDNTKEDRTPMSLPEPKGALKVESVSRLVHGRRSPTLRDVTFALSAGSSVGVIGPSAAGKSTLARIILGIWSPVSGTVRLDEAEINQWSREDLGRYVGYLPQDIELFDGTISENIARFGEVDPHLVVEAARLVDVHEMILRFPEGYDTVIGATSGQLSAGQRQRIALARALYRNPKLVVLDEPNSNLDELGEAALCQTLLKLKALHTTVIIISHRPNVLTLVDNILVLNNGIVADYGPSASIINKYKHASPKQGSKGKSIG
ncbi:type I secretion system permease/ATPase [Vibrio sp. HN007]|uniref:type I secretion system permease/ATPase n=1 Tax=Vibrio iocasae TaxID=3098914 RepID=UPI0035D4595B